MAGRSLLFFPWFVGDFATLATKKKSSNLISILSGEVALQ
jgi:hypothetical protein